jgi:type IV pilus assembly protein PilW
VGSTAQQLPFSGPYYTGVGADVTLTSFGLGSYAILMGNAADNPPQATMYGVDANGVLMSYDMLRLGAAGDSPVALAEGVVQMRALYGIDDSGPTGPNPDGIIDRWVDPGVAPYDRATLMDGSVASRTRLRHITAVRLGLILRTSLVEVDTKDIDKRVAAADISLFGDIPALKQTRVLTDDERRMRHRTVEVTIPLRNLLLAPPK